MASSMEEQLNMPALDPPPGITPHFSSNPDLPWFIPATVLITVIPGVLVLLRLYTKIRIVRKTDATEYITVIGFLFYLSLVICGHVAKHNGAGQHQWNLYRKDLNNVLYWINICEILYCPAIFMVKLAILLQYMYLLAPSYAHNRVLSIGSWILIITNLIFYIISGSISIGTCRPREKIWNDLVPGKCLNNNILVVFTSIWNILSDIAILVLPAHTVWKLRISTRKKLRIISLFAIGLLAVITNAFIIMHLLRSSDPNADISYNLLFIGIWAAIEICLGMIVVTMLTIPKFIDARFKRFFSIISKSFSAASSSVASVFTSAGTQRDRIESSQERDASLGAPFADVELESIAVGPSKPGFRSSTMLLEPTLTPTATRT